jgi:hypothetical protein
VRTNRTTRGKRTRRPAPHSTTITSSRPAGDRDPWRADPAMRPRLHRPSTRPGASRRSPPGPPTTKRRTGQHSIRDTDQRPRDRPGASLRDAASSSAHIRLIWLSTGDSTHLLIWRTESAIRFPIRTIENTLRRSSARSG